jgi:LPS-assembly protein
MKNSSLIFFFITIFFSVNVFAENLLIEAKNISVDKNKQITIFQNEVIVTTEDNDVIKSDYAEYNKKIGSLIFKENIIAIDNKGNTIETNYAEYNENNKIFKSNGLTKITTSEKYIIEGNNISLNNIIKLIKSDSKTTIIDQDKNKIYLDNFEYQTTSNIFKSIGFVKIIDNKNNSHEFSQIYIDTKKKEILGTDNRSFFNQNSFKTNERNKPRVFANSVQINENQSTFGKSVFTLCDYRKNDKCPPWSLQSTKMIHDRNKKTIFYDNAVIKIYDFPIFYLPKLSHPDPSVDRRSGFLVPTLSNSKNLGSGFMVPYFWALDKDKDFTFKNKLYSKDNPLIMSEYRQAFNNGNLVIDTGYTKGFQNESSIKKKGDKSHFFSKFVKEFIYENGSESSFELDIQHISNDKYLKLYKIESSLVDNDIDFLENSLNFTYDHDDFFLGMNAKVYETLKDNYNDKYEYILPSLTLDKNLFSNKKVGIMDLQTNIEVRNYDTNKTSKYFVNDLVWDIKNFNYASGIRGKFLNNIKNVNYKSDNIPGFKEKSTSELFNAFGYLTEVDFFKKTKNQTLQKLSPKALFRYGSGPMKKEPDGARIDTSNIFTMDRLENLNQFETGLSATLGFDYEFENYNKNFLLSMGQIINEKEDKDFPSSSSLDEKLSDVVGKTSLEINKKFTFNYDFALDQNYKDLNYSEISTTFNLDLFKFDFNYLQEKKHIGSNEYIKTNVSMNRDDNSVFSLSAKRNLVTNSSEYYDLSYEYLNDCLRAGVFYRREFYDDSELEPEDSLMFKITLMPFGNIDTPSFSK